MGFPIISVIVPVYNAVEYLERTAGYLAEQTYQNLEIILVDDGSIDGSSELCDQIAKKDARFKVLHQKNGGVCAARNAGIAVASGKYIGFCDADDKPYRDMYETLYQVIEENGCDIATIKSAIHFTDGKVLEVGDETLNIYTDQNEIIKSFLLNEIQSSVYTKLFRTDICRQISFLVPRKINEDRYYVFCALRKCTKLGVKNVIKYRYSRHEGSAATQQFSDKYLDIIYFADLIERDIVENIPELSEYARINKIISYIRVCQLMILLKGEKRYKEKYEECRAFLKKQDPVLCRKYLKKGVYMKYRLCICGKIPFEIAVKLFSKF